MQSQHLLFGPLCSSLQVRLSFETELCQACYTCSPLLACAASPGTHVASPSYRVPCFLRQDRIAPPASTGHAAAGHIALTKSQPVLVPTLKASLPVICAATLELQRVATLDSADHSADADLGTCNWAIRDTVIPGLVVQGLLSWPAFTQGFDSSLASNSLALVIGSSQFKALQYAVGFGITLSLPASPLPLPQLRSKL